MRKFLLPIVILLFFLHGIQCSSVSCTSFKKVSIVEEADTCNLDENTTRLSLVDLDRDLTSCTIVYLCSKESTVFLNKSFSIHNIHSISFIGLKNFSLDCGTNRGLEFTNVTGLSMKDLHLVNCARKYNMSVKFRTYTFLSGLHSTALMYILKM